MPWCEELSRELSFRLTGYLSHSKDPFCLCLEVVNDNADFKIIIYNALNAEAVGRTIGQRSCMRHIEKFKAGYKTSVPTTNA